MVSGRLSSAGGKPAFFFLTQGREVFPPAPPVATTSRPERRAAVKGAPWFGAAKRTLDGEHRSGIPGLVDGRRSGNTFPLVSFERVWFWTAGPTTAQEHTRRLITLIFAGRNRMVMIRRELPRAKRASWCRSPCRHAEGGRDPIPEAASSSTCVIGWIAIDRSRTPSHIRSSFDPFR